MRVDQSLVKEPYQVSKTKRYESLLEQPLSYSNTAQYVWPDLTTADAYIAKGMNTFRINILAERGVVGKDMKGAFAEEYINDLKTVSPS